VSDDDGMVLHIRTADLKEQAPVFGVQAENMLTAYMTLLGALNKAGAPWGDDKPGKEFHAQYAAGMEKIEKATTILSEGLSSIFTAMDDMADGHVENEDLIRAIFSKADPGKPHGGDE
jgi:predicted RNA-binding protein with PIN domain